MACLASEVCTMMLEHKCIVVIRSKTHLGRIVRPPRSCAERPARLMQGLTVGCTGSWTSSSRGSCRPLAPRKRSWMRAFSLRTRRMRRNCW